MSEGPSRAPSSASRSSAAFDEFARPYVATMRAIAGREVGSADAEDVVQEALLRAWRRWQTYDSARGSAKAWLCAILIDQARRRRRHARLRTTISLMEDPPLFRSQEPSATRIDIDRAIASLPRRQRQVICLFYLADLPVDEISGVLGVSDGSVKRHLFDARANLRKELKGHLND